MALDNTKIKFSGQFDIATKDSDGAANANFRKITFTDVTDYAGESIALADIIGWFVVKSPTGTIIHQGTDSSPDIDADVSLVFDTLEVPLDSLGDPLTGDYKIQYFVRDTNLSQDFSTNELTVKVCGSGCVADFDICTEITIDCDNGLATGNDLSVYGAGVSLDRKLTLTPPSGAKYDTGTDATPFVATGDTVNSDALWSRVWQLLLRVVVTTTITVEDMTFTTLEFHEGFDDADAACDVNLTAIYNCLVAKCEAIKATACGIGGIHESKPLADKLLNIVTEYTKMMSARAIGNREGVVTHYNELKTLLNCTCCDDQSTSELILAVSPTSPATTVSGTLPVIVTGNPTAGYVISLSQAFQDLVNTTLGSIVTSNDGSITVATSVNGVTGVVTYDLSVNAGAPSANVDEYTIAQDTIASLAVTDNDFFSSEVAVLITVAPSNGGAIVLPDGKTIQYTPTGGWSGVDTLTYQITDQLGATSTAVVTINVVAAGAGVCAVVSANYQAILTNENGYLKVDVANLTNYNGNLPTGSVWYFVDIKDSGGAIIKSYAFVGDHTVGVFTSWTTPEVIAEAWDTVVIRIEVPTQVDDGSGGFISCGTSNYTSSPFGIPEASGGFNVGNLNLSCIEGLPADPTGDDVIQALINEVFCNTGDGTAVTDNLNVRPGRFGYVDITGNDSYPNGIDTIEIIDTPALGAFDATIDNNGVFLFRASEDAVSGSTEQVQYRVTDSLGGQTTGIIQINILSVPGSIPKAGEVGQMQSLLGFEQGLGMTDQRKDNPNDSIFNWAFDFVAHDYLEHDMVLSGTSYVSIANSNLTTNPTVVPFTAVAGLNGRWEALVEVFDADAPLASGLTSLTFHLEFTNGDVIDRVTTLPSIQDASTDSFTALQAGFPDVYTPHFNGLTFTRDSNGREFTWDLGFIDKYWDLISGTITINYEENCGGADINVNSTVITLAAGVLSASNGFAVAGSLKVGSASNLAIVPDVCGGSPYHAKITEFIVNLNLENGKEDAINFNQQFDMAAEPSGTGTPGGFTTETFETSVVNDLDVSLDTPAVLSGGNATINLHFDTVLDTGIELVRAESTITPIAYSSSSMFENVVDGAWEIKGGINLNGDTQIELKGVNPSFDLSPTSVEIEFDLWLSNGGRYNAMLTLVGGAAPQTVTPS